MTAAPDSPLATLWCPAPNREPRRDGRMPDMLVLHYTGMESSDAALDWLTREESKVSCHYLVDEDGRIAQMVRESERAWHAGQSLWAGETVSHEGAAGNFQNVKLSPLPVQQPLEVWLGGTVPAALERCGRLSDGWLPSLCTPEEAAAGRAVIDEAAAKAGRSISGEHFGMSIGYAREPIPPDTARVLAARRPRALELTPVGLPAVRQLLERFLGVGFSKFVLRPVVPPKSWRAELEALSGAVGDLQT